MKKIQIIFGVAISGRCIKATLDSNAEISYLYINLRKTIAYEKRMNGLRHLFVHLTI